MKKTTTHKQTRFVCVHSSEHLNSLVDVADIDGDAAAAA